MKFVETEIKGLFIVEPKVFPDGRGYFFESYNQKEFSENGINAVFVQDNQSKSSYGVIRGMHCQTGESSQAKLVRVLEGEVQDVVVDVREGSPTFGKHISIILSADNKRMLFIPRNFLHGFAVLSEEAVFSYKCDNIYDSQSELRIRFDDEDMGIKWLVPKDKIMLSPKDENARSFKSAFDYGC